MTPDPDGVSNDAYQVWNIYKKYRKDIEMISFSTNEIKNLDLEYEYDEVLEVFYAYYKENTTITKLLGKKIKY